MPSICSHPLCHLQINFHLCLTVAWHFPAAYTTTYISHIIFPYHLYCLSRYFLCPLLAWSFLCLVPPDFVPLCYYSPCYYSPCHLLLESDLVSAFCKLTEVPRSKKNPLFSQADILLHSFSSFIIIGISASTSLFAYILFLKLACYGILNAEYVTQKNSAFLEII